MSFHAAETGSSLHVLHAFTYANAAARTTAVGLLSTDIGKLALQSDIGAYFELVNNTGPVWKQVTNPLTTKGDIYSHDSTDVAARLPVGTDGQVLSADSTASTGLRWIASGTSPSQPFELENLGLAASVSSNNLTIALKQADGSSDPSGGSPVKIGFRDITSTSGAYFERLATTATSIILNMGSSLGLASSQDQHIYVYALDHTSTVELAVSASSFFDESSVQSTTAEGGGTATSSTILYSTTARTNIPVRLIGRIQVNEATSGTYATSPSEVSLNTFSLKPSAKLAYSGEFDSASTINVNPGLNTLTELNASFVGSQTITDTANSNAGTVTSDGFNITFNSVEGGTYEVNFDVSLAINNATSFTFAIKNQSGTVLNSWTNTLLSSMAGQQFTWSLSAIFANVHPGPVVVRVFYSNTTSENSTFYSSGNPFNKIAGWRVKQIG